MNPILLDFPSQFCTERLLIRMPMPGDGRAVYDAIQASLEQMRPWLPFVHHEQSEELTEAGVREAHLKFLKREDMRLLLFLKDTDQLIGSSGLHNPNWNVPKFEIGYWIHAAFGGRGYMTEAVRGITRFAFHELKARRVEIRCDARNEKSRAIPERLGYQLEGRLRNDDLSADGQELRDTLVYATVSAV